MNNDFLSDLLKAIRLIYSPGSNDRILADEASKAHNAGLIGNLQKQKTDLEQLYNQYQIEQTKYHHIDYSKTIESIKHNIDLCNIAINDLIIEIEKDEQIIRDNDERRRNGSNNFSGQ